MGDKITSASTEEAQEQEGVTHRASQELPNNEELATTTAQMAGYPTPLITDYEVLPDEPYGGAERLGLTRDGDLIRRTEAPADADIYTDFPERDE